MFAALRSGQFRLLISGMLIVNIGVWMQVFGQGWLVVQLAIQDGSPQLASFYLGLIGLARAVPGLTFGLLAGATADRFDRRKILFATNLTSCTLALLLATLTQTGVITILMVILLAAANTGVQSFDLPTRQAMLPRLVRPRELASAIGLSSASHNGPQMIAPALGGLLILPIGIAGLFFLNSFGFLAVILALVFLKPVPVIKGKTQVSILTSVRDGLTYVASEPVIRGVVIYLVLTSLFLWPYTFLLPAFASNVLHTDAIGLSWVMAMTGMGALAGSLMIASLGGARRPGRIFMICVCAASASLMFFSRQTELMVALPAAFAVGLTTMMVAGVANTILQTTTPDRLRGRVTSVQTMISMGVLPVGQLVIGGLGSLIGIDVSLLLAASIALASGLFGLFRLRPVNDLVRRHADGATT